MPRIWVCFYLRTIKKRPSKQSNNLNWSLKNLKKKSNYIAVIFFPSIRVTYLNKTEEADVFKKLYSIFGLRNETLPQVLLLNMTKDDEMIKYSLDAEVN